MWIKAGSAPNSNLIGNDDFSFWVGGTNLNVNLPTGGSNGYNMPYPLNDSVWHLLDFTYDGTHMVLYEDGQAFTTLTFGGPYNTVPSRGLTVGGLNASYDEVAIYGSALSAARINAHWTRGGSSTTTCATAPSGALEQSIVSAHPVAFMPMKDLNQDASDRVAFDVSGNCFNGSYTGGFTANSSDQPIGDSDGSVSVAQGGGAARQSGTQLPSGNGARSIGLWIKSTSSPNANVLYEDDFGFWMGGANINPTFPNGGSIGVGMPYPLGDGVWHQVYETYDGSQLSLYEDGQVFYTTTVSGQYSTAPSHGLRIGDYPGKYTDVAAYASALSAAAINQQWSRGGSKQTPCLNPTSAYAQSVLGDTPRAFLPLHDLVTDSTDRVAFDAANCMNGVYNLAAAADSADTPPGDSGGSVTLNGGVMTANGTQLPNGNAARTFEVWIKSSSASNSNVLYQGDFGFWIGGSNLNMTFPDGSSWGYGMPTTLNDNQWHLIDYVYDGTLLRLYEDGGLFGTTGLSGSKSAYSTSPSANLAIGPFHGSWADVVVYAGALSPSRVGAHYNAGAGTGPVGGAYGTTQSAGGQNLCIACLLSKALNGLFGDPVNTATGNLTENVGDLAITGSGRPLQITRSYNSQSASSNGPLGYGWTFDYNASLAQDPGTGNVTITQENGSQVTFTKSGSTYAPSAPRFIATLVQNGDGTFTLTRQARQTLVFSSSGQLLSETDLNGYKTTFAYTSGRLTGVTQNYDTSATPVSRTLTLTYDGNQHLSTVADPSGRTVMYQYNDGAGNLTDVFDVNAGHWIYTYDTAHHLTRIQDPNGNTTTNTFDPTSGKVTAQKQDQLLRTTTFAYSGDPMSATGGTTTITDPKGNVTVETYKYGLRVSAVKGSGTAQSATWTYTYDPGTLGITTITDPNGHVTTRAYDQSGNVVRTSDPLGRVTTWTYNTFNEPLTVTDPMGITSTSTYDANGNALTQSTPLSGSNQTRTVTNTYGDSIHPNDVAAITDPNGKISHFTYDGYGDLTSATDPLGNKTTDTYNSLGWKTTTVSPKGNVSGCSCASQYTTTFSYVDGQGHTDQYGDVQSVTDALGRVTSRTYDADRNISTSTDAKGKTTTYRYDAANAQIEVDRVDGTKTTTTYNGDGTVATQVDGNGNTTSYSYDALGRPASVTTPATAACPSGCTSHTIYDGVGNRLSSVDVAGQTTTYSYDAANQVTGISYSNSTTPSVTGITYDGDGARLQMTDGTGTSRWTFDSLHRLTSYTSGSGATVGYSYQTPAGGYDLTNRVDQIAYPNGVGTVSRTYDDAGRLTSVTDWNNQSVAFTYDTNSNLVTAATPSTQVVTDTYGYDAADHITSVSDSGASSLFAATYTRDGNGQLTGDSSLPSAANSFQYTSLNQVCYAGSAATSPCSSPPQGAQAFSYDPAGNPTQLGSNATQAFDAGDELCWTSPSQSTNACGTVPSGATSYVFDSRGNRSAQVPATGSATCYTYDQADRLVSASSGTGSVCTSGTTIGTYAYDGDGLRQSKTIGGSTTQFSWDVSSSLPLLLQQTTAGVVTSNIYGPGGLPVEQITSSRPAITMVGTPTTATDAIGSSASLQVALPSGVAPGDAILLATTYAQGVNNSASVPTGYVPVGSAVVSAAALPTADITQVFRKLAGSGETSPTLTYSGTFTKAAVVVVYRGLDQTAPVDVIGTGMTAGGTSVSASTTTRFANEQLLLIQGASYTATAAGSWNGPSGAAQQARADAGTVNIGAADEPKATAGATGTLTSTFTTSGTFLGQPQLTAVLIGLQKPPLVIYLHHDQLGSTRLLTDTLGNARGAFSYDTYGNMALATAPGVTSFLFAGQYRDVESGLYDLRTRYYDPGTAQFLARDPLAATTGQPYAYVGGNPLNNTDPTGLCSINPFSSDSCIGDAAGAVGGAVAGGAKAAASAVGSAAGAVYDTATHLCLRNPLGGDNGNGGCETTLSTSQGAKYAGLALGAGAAVTGVGAFLDAEVFGLSSGALGGISMGAGGAAGALDLPGCLSGDKVACLGAGLGLTGAAAGGPELLGELLFGVEEDTTGYAVLKGISAFGLNVGFAGTTLDAISMLLGGCGG